MKRSPITWPAHEGSGAALHEPARTRAGPMRVTPRAGTPPRILVIDDKADLVASLRYALEMAGYAVEVAYDGEEGICKAIHTQPEIILSDIGLPGRVDGFVIAETLRASGLFESTHMVAITGASEPEDVERAWSAGFDVHLAKPVEVRSVLSVIAGLLDEESPTQEAT